jgi:hypothetical protein
MPAGFPAGTSTLTFTSTVCIEIPNRFTTEVFQFAPNRPRENFAMTGVELFAPQQ